MDGKYLVVASNDDQINFYSLQRGDKTNTYQCKKYGVSHVKFANHCKLILCASTKEGYYRVCLWSLHDNTILAYFIGHVDEITGIEVSPLNSFFLSSAKNEEVRLWDYNKKECLAVFNETSCGTFDNTGQVIALAYVTDKQ